MIRLLSSLLLFAAWPAWADAVSDQLTAAGIVEFTAAYQAWDGTRFGAAAELFRQASTNAPANVTNFYWLGAAEFHRCLELRPDPANAPAAEAAMEAAVEALKQYEYAPATQGGRAVSSRTVVVVKFWFNP